MTPRDQDASQGGQVCRTVTPRAATPRRGNKTADGGRNAHDQTHREQSLLEGMRPSASAKAQPRQDAWMAGDGEVGTHDDRKGQRHDGRGCFAV